MGIKQLAGGAVLVEIVALGRSGFARTLPFQADGAAGDPRWTSHMSGMSQATINNCNIEFFCDIIV